MKTIKFTLMIIIMLILGFIIGLVTNIKISQKIENILLYILIFAAGFSLGSDNKIKIINNRKVIKPIMYGTLQGIIVMIAGAFSGLLVARISGVDNRLLAVAGMASGWYTLAGPIVGMFDPLLGIVAFMVNLARESIHILLYPVLARIGYRIEAISIGGATTMDTGLPVVVLFAGESEAIVAVAQGAVITFLVPFIIALLYNI